jgi:hypothetical protein
MPTPLFGLVFVGGTVALSLLGMVLVRRTISVATLEAHNDVAGVIYAVIGTIYAVLLAFVVLTVWEEWDRAEWHTEEEAEAIGALARIADGLPDPDRGQARQALLDYARTVRDDEWAAMADVGRSERAAALFEQIWNIFEQGQPVTEREKALYSESLSRFEDLSKARAARLYESNNSLPHVMWAVLSAGAIVTIGFGLFLGVKNARAQAAITIALSATIGLMLFLVHVMDLPFRGDVRIQPHAFDAVLLDLANDSRVSRNQASR